MNKGTEWKALEKVFQAGQWTGAIYLDGEIYDCVLKHRKILIGTEIRFLIIGAHSNLNIQFPWFIANQRSGGKKCLYGLQA